MPKKIMAVNSGSICLPEMRKIPQNKPLKKSIGLTKPEKAKRSKSLRNVQRMSKKCVDPNAVKCLISVETTAQNACTILKNTLHNHARRKAGETDFKYYTSYKISLQRYIVDLLLQRKYTDKEIIAKLQQYYHSVNADTLQKYICNVRSIINRGNLKTPLANGILHANIGKIYSPSNDEKRAILPYCVKYSKTKRRKAFFSLQVI